MYEVEAKVWIKSAEKWQAVLKEVKKIATYQKEESKEDLYYSKKESKEAIFRLRTTNKNTHEVTIKKKKITNGIETSKEESFKIDNISSFLSFAKDLELEIILKKNKHSQIFQKDDISIELNTIENLGNFLEIEKLCQDKKEGPQANQAIIQTFAELGFTPQDFEERPYLKIILNQ